MSSFDGRQITREEWDAFYATNLKEKPDAGYTVIIRLPAGEEHPDVFDGRLEWPANKAQTPTSEPDADNYIRLNEPAPDKEAVWIWRRRRDLTPDAPPPPPPTLFHVPLGWIYKASRGYLMPENRSGGKGAKEANAVGQRFNKLMRTKGGPKYRKTVAEQPTATASLLSPPETTRKRDREDADELEAPIRCKSTEPPLSKRPTVRRRLKRSPGDSDSSDSESDDGSIGAKLDDIGKKFLDELDSQRERAFLEFRDKLKATFRRDIQILESEKKGLLKRVEELERKARISESLEERLATLKSVMEAKDQEVEKLKKKVKRKTEQLAQRDGEIVQLKADIEGLQAELSTTKDTAKEETKKRAFACLDAIRGKLAAT